MQISSLNIAIFVDAVSYITEVSADLTGERGLGEDLTLQAVARQLVWGQGRGQGTRNQVTESLRSKEGAQGLLHGKHLSHRDIPGGHQMTTWVIIGQVSSARLTFVCGFHYFHGV